MLKSHLPTQVKIEAKKAETIQKMFDEVSPRYDLANTLLSFGIHHLWRRRLVSWSEAQKGHQVLDCATGTGDLIFRFEKVVSPSPRLIGTDFSEGMLTCARKKADERDSLAAFQVADVMNLPYEDESFDFSSISFGIRNVADPIKALSELARVVRPGGRVMVLEFGQPQRMLIRQIYKYYSDRVLPKVGGVVSGQPLAYRYLQDSSARFPCGERFLELAKGTSCFSKLEMVPLTFGVAYAYRLTRK